MHTRGPPGEVGSSETPKGPAAQSAPRASARAQMQRVDELYLNPKARVTRTETPYSLKWPRREQEVGLEEVARRRFPQPRLGPMCDSTNRQPGFASERGSVPGRREERLTIRTACQVCRCPAILSTHASSANPMAGGLKQPIGTFVTELVSLRVVD
jgi:hypothetical protein